MGRRDCSNLFRNVIAKGIYDPNRDVLKDVGYNALVGALSGGVVGGVIGAAEKHPAAAAPPSEQQVAEAGAGLTQEAPPETPGAPLVQPPVQPGQMELPLTQPTGARGASIGAASGSGGGCDGCGDWEVEGCRGVVAKSRRY